MSNILKSKRKESSFQIYIDWLKLRQRLTEYVSSDFNDSKISYNEPNSLKYPNYLYFLFWSWKKATVKSNRQNTG